MILLKRKNAGRGFTLAEVMIVVAIVAILATVAVILIRPGDISYIEYNRDAEAIATAVQNRLTDIRNTGDMSALRGLGVSAVASGTPSTGAGTSAEDAGGLRCVFSHKSVGTSITSNGEMSYILPFGAIEHKLTQSYYVVCYESDTGMVRFVLYSEKYFGDNTFASIEKYIGSFGEGDTAAVAAEAARKADNIGYYEGEVDSQEVAFANLPTPQLTVTNYEELTLNIFLPEVKQLKGKNIGFIVSLADKNGDAYKGSEGKQKLTFADAAIYSTIDFGNGTADPRYVKQKVTTGANYKMILDTVRSCTAADLSKSLTIDENGSPTPTDQLPKGIFEDWANRTKAFKKYFKLGENTNITVTVYCLDDAGAIDPTFLPRSATITFNGWFNDCKDDTHSDGRVTGIVDIACGRHLQNIGKISVMRENLIKYLPTVEDSNDDGIFEYGKYDRGMADVYTDGSSNASPEVKYEDVTEKYVLRDDVFEITEAQQVNAIDFNTAGWKEDGKPIPFTPINLPYGFYYYGNYLTISHLYVNAPFYAGLFGYAYHPRLYDIQLVDPSVTSQMPAQLAELYEMGVGGLIGTSRDSSHINNCQVYLSGDYDSEKYRVQGECYVGGLIGFCEDENIKNCSASVYTGYPYDASTTAGAVSDPLSKYVGGLIGCITGDSDVDNCYAAGNLSGEYVGGLVGFIIEDSDPSGDDYRIHTCYTAGHIEYASKEAAGILGHVSELAGNAKSALSIYGNYCVVIYGIQVENGNKYEWANNDVPIYGTFKGDGFEWIRTAGGYLKAKFSGHTYFGGAVFEQNNKNYYIAQKGITYSSSPYFTAMESATEQLLSDITDNSITDKSTLLSKVEAAEKKIFYLKKIQALEELKSYVEEVVAEIDEESGYIDDPYPSFYLEPDHSVVHSSKDGTCILLTVKQLVHVIYDGTYTDSNGQKQTVELTYTGSSYPDFQNVETKHSDGTTKSTDKTNIASYTFMGFYKALMDEYEKLVDNDTADDAAAEKRVKLILGDTSKEMHEHKESSGTWYEYPYQYDSPFYHFFYSELLYKTIDKAKDYYQDNGDKNGELLFRHFRSDLCGKIDELLCDLSMTAKDREDMLFAAKKGQADAAQKIIDELSEWPDVINKWNSGMKDEKEKAKALVENATNTLKTLIAELGKDNSSTFADAGVNAYNAMNELYIFFETNKDKEDGNIDTTGKVKNMRAFRDPIEDSYLGTTKLLAATLNSGVENALQELKIALGKDGANVSALKTEFKTKINSYLGILGDGWTAHDSGHELKNATEIRNAIKGFIDGIEKENDVGKEASLGFMYDYGNKKSSNPYKTSDLPNGSDSYVDLDNGIYNNVFPYNENAFTKFYPFPFVFGREIEGGKQPVYVLFHYGDWLTYDLWKETDVAVAALSEASFQMSYMAETLETTAENGDVVGSIALSLLRSRINALKNAMDVCALAISEAINEPPSTARDAKLSDIKQTIEGWFAKSGEFVNLEDSCNSAKALGNWFGGSEAIDALSEKLVTYRKNLQDLIKKIDDSIGA